MSTDENVASWVKLLEDIVKEVETSKAGSRKASPQI